LEKGKETKTLAREFDVWNGRKDGRTSLTQFQSIYLERLYLSKVAFPFVFEISSDKLTRKFWFQRCVF
jgi:hypothetical protein